MSGAGVAVLDDAAFDDLTERQLEALCNVAFGGHGAGLARSTVKSLERRGLIERLIVANHEGSLYFTFTIWEMPVHVHIAFCDWCSRQKLLFMDDES